jgi:CHAD domain-containing protein
MAHRLHPGRAPGPQIRDFLKIEIDHALAEASLFDQADVHRRIEVIRQIRKATKRSRAIVSLLDPNTGDRFNRHLRHCARQLSSMRDRDVIHQTLAELADMDPKLSRMLGKRHLHERMLEFEDSELFEIPVDEELVLDAVSREMAWMRSSITTIGRRDLRWKFLLERVGRSWQRARRAFRSEWSSNDNESLHDARKAVIRLESQLVLVERVAPPRVRKARKELRGIAHELGLDRDLLLIQERAEELTGNRAFAEVRSGFLKRMLRDRNRQMEKIRSRGKRLLATPTGVFLEKMKKAVKSAKRGGSR